jgi:hypothetical protein
MAPHLNFLFKDTKVDLIWFDLYFIAEEPQLTHS